MATKKPKLSLDRTYGPAPAVGGRYGSSSTFVRMYRTYQWTQGYDVRVANDVPQGSTTLQCATHPGCAFSITALFHTFNDPEKDQSILGQQGYRIATSLPGDYHSFIPTHSHVAPYHPMNVQQENLRRSVLLPGDPSLDHPPLVRVEPIRGFAEGSPPADVETSVAASGGGGGGRSSSVLSTVKPEPSSSFTPTAVAPPASRMSTSSSTATYTNHQPPPSHRASPVDPAPAPAPAPVSTSSASLPPAAPLSTATPAPISTSTEQGHALASTPLGSFLLQISPSFLDVLPRLDAAGIPLDTTGQDLVDLDTDDTTIWDLFHETGFLSIAQVALATDGVRKARDRLQAAPDQPLNPRLVQGLQKAKAERWIRRKIAEGQGA
ncbi:hypothetical protein JCM11491_001081 [Sporobolomyces phaffii]